MLDALDVGQSSLKVAVRFGVSEAFVRKLRNGHYEWFPPPGGARLLSEKDEERLCWLALDHADATIPELRALSASELGLVMSITTVGRRLREMGMTRKVPELRHGDVVVMDNLAAHKKPVVHDLIERVGARVLYLRRIRRTSIPSNPAGPSSSRSYERLALGPPRRSKAAYEPRFAPSPRSTPEDGS